MPSTHGAAHPAQADVADRHQRKGREEVLAELAIGDPGCALDVPLERERVDEHRLRAAELDVVGGRVAQGQPRVKRLELDVERQERRVLELPEAPLVGVADEVELLRPDDPPRGGRVERGLEGHVLERQHRAGRHQALVQTALEVRLPVGLEGRRDLAVDRPVAPEDEPGGITPGARVPDGHGPAG
ncbi:MAG: hypothetical protein U0869_01760 [Chloroflexota bacterium]